MTAAARVLIVGAGAQAKYAAETFQSLGIEVAAVLSTSGDPPDWPRHYGLVTSTFDGDADTLRGHGATRAIACAAKPADKRTLIDAIDYAGLELASAVHPDAVIATTATLGRGLVVNAHATVQPFAEIGDGAMIHAGTVVEHDAKVGAFANLAPRVALAGWVRVGSGAVVNTGAVAIPGVTIGEEAVIGAGAVVTADIPPGSLAVGVPAKVKRTPGEGPPPQP